MSRASRGGGPVPATLTLRPAQQFPGAGGEQTAGKLATGGPRVVNRGVQPVGDPLRAVRQPHERMERDPLGVHTRMRADRRVAARVQLLDDRALRLEPAARGRVVERADRLLPPRLPIRVSSASRPCPGAGTNWSQDRGCAPSSRPRRRRPASASTTASYSPSASFRRRVSTLPRNGRTWMRGLIASSWERRRRLDVPTRAPSGSSSMPLAVPTSASRGSSPLGTAAIARPSGSRPGTSFALWTARSTSPASRASSISFTNRDLSAGAARPVSPLVVMGTIWISAPSAPRAVATAFACTSASALPRVPMRRGFSVSGAAGASGSR